MSMPRTVFEPGVRAAQSTDLAATEIDLVAGL